VLGFDGNAEVDNGLLDTVAGKVELCPKPWGLEGTMG